eukprot:470509_1
MSRIVTDVNIKMDSRGANGKRKFTEYDELRLIISKKRNKPKDKFEHTSMDYYPLFINISDNSIIYGCLSSYVHLQSQGRYSCFTAKSALIGGYKLERKRMFDMKQYCAHRSFPSVSDLLNRGKHLFHQFDRCNVTWGHIEDTREELHTLFGDGNCNQCCINLTSSFFTITARKYSDATGIWARNVYDNDHKTNWIVALLTNMMQYPHLCHFIWNSQIHVTLLTELMCILTGVSRGCTLEIQRLNDADLRDDPKALMWTRVIDYNVIMLLQMQLLRNLKLIKKAKWYTLIHCYVIQWMVFILEQLVFRVFKQKEREAFGNSVMINFVHLICYAFYYLVKYPEWKKKLFGNSRTNRFKISGWFEALESLWKDFDSREKDDMDPVSFYVLCTLICLQNDEFVVMKHKEIKRLSTMLFRVKWYEMECHNVCCDKRRFNVNEFYKCEGCKVARYCSKRCQKKDWNLYNHESVCNGLKELQAKYERKQNELQKLSKTQWKKLERMFMNACEAMDFMRQYERHEFKGSHSNPSTLRELVNDMEHNECKQPAKCNVCDQEGSCCNAVDNELLMEL